MKIKVLIADYSNDMQGKDIGYLVNCYAADPMGGGKSLPDNIKNSLAPALSKIPHAFTVLCYVDERPVGLVNCFEGFSTFNCKPLINIHDMFVSGEFRGLGISQKLLTMVEEVAKEKDCCKITLEVLEGNKAAQSAYVKYGFTDYELDPIMGKALFWQKYLHIE
jgi:ribosomal protein S18 acetylase RimI-like enzyme